MLGWMVKRGLDGGRDATEDADDTQVTQPDTPGPVFAARAFKSALFGTPARPDATTDDRPLGHDPKISSTENASNIRDRATPGRLPGILLTPGTATSRRKRVSFGNNVEYEEGSEAKPEFKIDKNARKPSLFADKPKQPQTTLAQALENSRNQNNKAAAAAAEEKPATDDDNAWEEVDDNENEMDWEADVTVDLNEPHSQSGRYWKSQFQRYQEDARAEMGKLLKYKQLAKSYAKMKDSEAGDIHAKLQEEKDKVTQMEARITQLANQIARTRTKGSDHDYQELISDLTRQTALAVQYRNQVKELEAMLQDTNADDVFRDAAGASSEASSGASSRRRAQNLFTSAASPRTQKTLVDTQRELRRARDQAKELAQVKDEVRRLKMALRAAEQKTLSSESKSKSLAADLASSEAAADAAAAKVQDLEARAKFAEDERRRKDDEVRLLQRKYDSLKEDAKARVGEAEQVLRRKNEQIASLKRQVKQGALSSADSAIAVDEKLLDLDMEPAPAKTASKAEKPAAATASSISLAALEKITRNRYETLSRRRSAEDTKASRKQQSTTGGMAGLVLDVDDLHFSDSEPELPQQKLGNTRPSKHSQKPQKDQKEKDEPIAILEDETSHFEMPPVKPVAGKGAAATTTARLAMGARLRAKDAAAKRLTHKTVSVSVSDGEGDQDAVAAAKLILLRRRRAASPLCPVEKRPNGVLESKYKPLAATKKRVAAAREHDDPVTAAAAAAADASSLSISSTRAAAAVERIEKRRRERQRELGLQQNKENMQPA